MEGALKNEILLDLPTLAQYLAQILPDTIADYCPNGIQVEGSRSIAHLATAVTASLATIEKAVENKVDALLVHHGIFWNKDKYEITGVKRQKIKLLLDNGISLLSYHLPLDAHREYGNNWKAARALNLQELEPFGLYQGTHIGVKGVLPPMSRQKFKEQLELYYLHPAYCAWGGPEQITSVGIISGGAHGSIREAVAHQLDCYVTGSFDEPIWHTAHEEKINFYAMGHSATERIAPQAIGEHLSQYFRIRHTFIDIPNPF